MQLQLISIAKGEYAAQSAVGNGNNCNCLGTKRNLQVAMPQVMSKFEAQLKRLLSQKCNKASCSKIKVQTENYFSKVWKVEER